MNTGEELVTNKGKLISERESKFIAKSVRDEFPNDSKDDLIAKTVLILKYIQKQRIENNSDNYRVRMLLRGILPRILRKKNLLKADEFEIEWSA